MRRLRSVLRFAAVLPVAVLAGCGDGGGEELSGTIGLAPGVRAGDFESLELRMYADPGGPFDPSQIPGDAWGQEESATVPFPYAYDLRTPDAPSDGSTWRMVAWLSLHQTIVDPHKGIVPAKGDVLCTATGNLPSCGSYYGGHCGQASGVDCTLASPLQ
jgi:hypothetical protein